jgi:hypothetical protein
MLQKIRGREGGGKRHYTVAFWHLTPTPIFIYQFIYFLSLSLSLSLSVCVCQA